MTEKNKLKKKKRGTTGGRLIRRFVAIVVSTVLLYSMFAAVGVVIYGVTRNSEKVPTVAEVTNSDEKTENSQAQTDDEDIKKITNVAVFGSDKGGTRTDVMFVVSFNSETKEINILSIPRDTKVKMTDEMIASLEERKRSGFIPYHDGQKGVCKINEVHAYAGDGYRNEFSMMMVEDLLGIKLDYYVKFTPDTFKTVVDSICGVDFEVATDMKYSDPEQGLYINLKAGYQHLDGDKAEQLVRYRDGYAAKDLKRITVQQDFIKALMQKVLSTDTLLTNIQPLTKTVISTVETNISIMDALKYVKYVNYIDVDNVKMETIPGVGGSYFKHDKEGTADAVARLIYRIDTQEISKDNDNENTNE
ncbi:MAG: LCP family protein [Lachnospiraceae bacterium]|nr:LCP family protein [Lachnospiraceae bacterium]